MVTTRVINQCGCVIEIEEGNAGVWSNIATVQPDKSYNLTLNPNATYREFVLFNEVVASPGSTATRRKITLTSDDCMDASEIRILVDPETQNFITKKVEQNKKKGLTDDNIIGWYAKAKDFFGSILGKVHSRVPCTCTFATHCSMGVEVFRSLSKHMDRFQDDHVHADMYLFSFLFYLHVN